ncbi:Uncharacterised protein [Neisseria meningitidis]|nr:Uncharacterised protein [Neisseria meningitidis]
MRLHFLGVFFVTLFSFANHGGQCAYGFGIVAPYLAQYLFELHIGQVFQLRQFVKGFVQPGKIAFTVCKVQRYARPLFEFLEFVHAQRAVEDFTQGVTRLFARHARLVEHGNQRPHGLHGFFAADFHQIQRGGDGGKRA